MDRPSLSPEYVATPTVAARRRWRDYWHAAAVAGGGLRWAMGQALLREMYPLGPPHPPPEDCSPLRRAVRRLVYRLLFLPMALILAVAALVYMGTHPPVSADEPDPRIPGAHCEAVYLAGDDAAVDAWLIPALEARHVLAGGERVLRQRHPAVVLVPDYGATWQQMLPYMRPLHDAGFVVMALTLRQDGTRAATFGLREAADVRAAGAFFSSQTLVDPTAIGCVGIGTGATACLLAAEQGAPLSALALDGLPQSFDDVAAAHLAPLPAPIGPWMRPLCKWSFELAFGVDADDVNVAHFTHLMEGRPIMVLGAQSGNAQQTVRFLEAKLKGQPPSGAGIAVTAAP